MSYIEQKAILMFFFSELENSILLHRKRHLQFSDEAGRKTASRSNPQFFASEVFPLKLPRQATVMAIEVVPLEEVDIPGAIEVIQRAFADDPYSQWVFDPSKVRSNKCSKEKRGRSTVLHPLALHCRTNIFLSRNAAN